MRAVFEDAFHHASSVLEAFRHDLVAQEALDQSVAVIVEAFQNGNKALSCGNGGSLADAMHFAEEFTGRFRKDRKPYPAFALSDPTHMSCVANDYGFEYVFSRQVEALGAKGDVLLLLSTSGNSENLVKAAEAGIKKGMCVIGFLGKGGGRLRSLCDIVVHAPGETSDRIQELHMLALHALIEAVEKSLGHEV